MTIVTEDDPEISFGGEDDDLLPSPSAPPVTASSMPDDRSSLDAMPTAIATTAVATMVPNIEAARVPSFVSRSLADGRTGNMERTTNPTDGSLSVKVTTTTHQPNGYREMTTEYFHIPSHMATTVSMAMDVAGQPPSSLYRTNVQHQILPPSSGAVVGPPTPASAYPITTPGQSMANDIAHQLASYTGGNNLAPNTHDNRQGNSGPTQQERKQKELRIFKWIFTFVLVAIGIVLGLTSDETSGSNSWPTPYPTPRPTTYQYCNGKRTGGTPGWKDSSGDNCDWYEEHDRDCSDASMYAGSMGTANENCCLCIVPASPTTMPSYSWYMTPKPSPYPTPKSSPYPLSSCSDHTNPQDSNGTPGWTDSNGRSCGWYQGTGPNNRCKDFGNKYNGGMGTANENCCYCMLQLTQMPSTKPTTSPNPTSTNSLIPLGPSSPASQPTLGSRNSFKTSDNTSEK